MFLIVVLWSNIPEAVKHEKKLKFKEIKQIVQGHE